MPASSQTLTSQTLTQRTPWWRWAVVIVPGVLLYFNSLPGMNPAQEHLFAFFVSTIIALVAQPVRMGVSVLLAMTLLAVTGT